MKPPDLRDISALQTEIDKAESQCGFSLNALREIAEMVAASDCAFEEIRLCFSHEGNSDRVIGVLLEFWMVLTPAYYYEVSCNTKELTLSGSSTNIVGMTFASTQTDACARWLIYWYECDKSMLRFRQPANNKKSIRIVI